MIEENFAGVPAEVTRKIILETANRLSNMEIALSLRLQSRGWLPG